jgi:glycosyltransferase involved in cell wall biosynthesis
VGQDYPGAIEILVVFDQEEPTQPSVPSVAGRTIRRLVNERSPGLAGARNTGILAAAGDLIAFCDDDDEWLPAKLRAQVEALRMNPEAEVAGTGVSIVYGRRSIDRIPPSDAITFDRLLRSRTQEIHPSSIIARRDAVMNFIGLVDEEIPGGYGEDYEWLLRSSRRAPIIAVKDPLVRAHWHPKSFFSDRWPIIIQSIHYLLAKYPEFRRERRGLARLYGRLAFANAALGKRGEARAWAMRTLRLDPRQRRAYLALGVSLHLVSADMLQRFANRSGRGI